MKTTNNKAFILIILIIITSTLAGDNKIEKIEWDSIGTNVVIIGKLGFPLGEIMEINGIVIDGNDTGLKAYSSEKLLKITKINDIDLENSKILEYVVYKSDITNPQINTEFHIRGYETGSFTGYPKGVNRLLLPASTDFYFETSFIITEIISLKELAKSSH